MGPRPIGGRAPATRPGLPGVTPLEPRHRHDPVSVF